MCHLWQSDTMPGKKIHTKKNYEMPKLFTLRVELKTKTKKKPAQNIFCKQDKLNMESNLRTKDCKRAVVRIFVSLQLVSTSVI